MQFAQLYWCYVDIIQIIDSFLKVFKQYEKKYLNKTIALENAFSYRLTKIVYYSNLDNDKLQLEAALVL